MAKPTKRNRKPVSKVDILNLPEGIYLDEKGYGEIHALTADTDDNDENILVYKGKLHKGAIALITGKKLTINIPVAGYNHGYTLEGGSQEIFKAEEALSIYSASEHRTFVYINPKSTLNFVGDPKKEYEITFHIYDSNRWVVINAVEL